MNDPTPDPDQRAVELHVTVRVPSDPAALQLLIEALSAPLLDVITQHLDSHAAPAGLEPNDLVDRAEAARLLGCSIPTLDRYRRDGLLTSIKPRENGRVQIRRADVQRFLDQHGV